MEPAVPLTLPEDAKCKVCGYALHLNTTGRCPECGREFDPADRRTFHRGCFDQAQLLLRWMLDARMMLGWLFFLGLVVDVMGNGRTAMIFMAASIVASVATLYFQTRLANLMLGRKEAVRYLFISLLVPPIMIAGPLLVPSLLAAEVRPRLK